MREETPNWLVRWEEELPSLEELIPISQTLITPHLALAFQIGSHNNHSSPKRTVAMYHQKLQPAATPTPTMMNSDFAVDSSTDLGSGGGGGGGEEPARTLKRPRLVWTPQLHKRFVDAVAHIGIKNAVPKTIMQLMSVEGLTRENVASHLQKYRLYLKRMQSGGGNVGESDRLFASSPVPAHFLHPTGRQSSDHFIPPFVPMAATLPHQQFLHRQTSAVNFTSQANNNGKVMEQSLFLARQSQHQPVLIRPSSLHLQSRLANYAEDLESGAKTVLTLFPTRQD